MKQEEARHETIVRLTMKTILGVLCCTALTAQSVPGTVARTQESKNQDIVSAKDFGAKGDGSADDTAALRNLFAAHPRAASVYLPTGTYSITPSTVALFNPQSFTLYGGNFGEYGTQLKSRNSTDAGYLLKMYGDDSHQPFQAVLKDFSLDCNGAPMAGCLMFQDVNLFDLERFEVFGVGPSGTGIYALPRTTSAGVSGPIMGELFLE